MTSVAIAVSVLLAPASLIWPLLPAMGLAFAAYLHLLANKAAPRCDEPAQASVAWLLLAQLPHLGELALSGFLSRWPVLYGEPPYPAGVFFGFALGAYVLLSACMAAWFQRRCHLALLPLLVLALFGGCGSALVHAGWAWRQGGYVPGLGTALLQGLAGWLALRRLSGSPRAASLLAFACVPGAAVTLLPTH
ncbi:hypothetical protein PEC18_23950 [Paucibacter sp. O1-1]|nr:hypothetical protein [Paucibacter sp. O1-1]MDA3828800.1 hypothetical protein [Paucibacter sp. O1-1]